MIQSLNGEWQLSWKDPSDGNGKTIPAKVPGNVIGDLTRAGIVPDPYAGTNSNLLRPYEFVDWEYRTGFSAPEPAEGERLELVFEGIDTAAEILVNGKIAGHACNMVIPHRFDVTDLVHHKEKNELVVKIRSSINEARKFRRPPSAVASTYNYEGLYLRRPMHTYGWDIAPRLVGAGLWRNVSLEIVKPERWTSLYLFTSKVSPEKAELVLDWSFTTPAETLENLEAHLTMRCGDSVLEQHFPLRFVTGVFEFDVPHPRLWNPLGSGEQNLYTVELKLIHCGKTVDVRVWETGIRTIRLERTEEMENGKGKFEFIVNNRPVFIKGSNWVPSDALHGENPERVGKALELFRDLGCNMVRCWGGNVYEDEEFFSLCDRFGLLVWQDFMFACEVPPHDTAFCETIRQEAEAVVTRLRNHPSLALWCGDNECDEFFFYKKSTKRLPPSFNRISREILPDAVGTFDPARDYLPSSPYLSDSLWRGNRRYDSPEQHLWGPRDNWKSSFYKDNTAIFASEIGYHGMPNLESIRKFIPEESLNGRIGNPDWLCHASQPFHDPDGPYAYRIQLMEDQVAGCFESVPETLEKFILCSQIVQAEAFKFFIESFRMRKWRKTGLIWWNVIDCWPQFSDAVVDYYYSRKLAYWYIRTAQKPLSLMFGEPESWCIRLYAVNDLSRPQSGDYKVSDILTGDELCRGSFEIAPDTAAEIDSLRICQGCRRMLLIEWSANGETCFNHYYQGSAPYDFEQYTAGLAILREKLKF